MNLACEMASRVDFLCVGYVGGDPGLSFDRRQETNECAGLPGSWVSPSPN